jgi:hypothetical protein
MEKVSFFSKDSQLRNGVIINQLWHTWAWVPGSGILLAKMDEAMFLDMLKILGMIQSRSIESEFIEQTPGK